MSAVVSERWAPSTNTQHDYIRVLFERLELTTRRFTYQHRAPFRAARLPEPAFDGDIAAHLQALSREEASRLITALQKIAGIDDEDDA